MSGAGTTSRLTIACWTHCKRIRSGCCLSWTTATGCTKPIDPDPDDYALLFSKGDRRKLAVWTVADKSHRIQIPSGECEFDVLSHVGEGRDAISAHDQVLTLTVSDSPQYLIADRPNPMLDRAPVAHVLRATLSPGPGKVLTVQVDNLADTAFQGTARLVDVAGIEAIQLEQPLALAAGETDRTFRFSLAAKPAGQCRVGLRIEDETGYAMCVLPSRRFVFLPDEVLTNCHVVADGDPQVPSDLLIAVAAAPQSLPESDAPVLKISYDFGDGWKFLRVVTSDSSPRSIAGKPVGFGFWIYGDGQGASPRLRIRDTTSQTWQPSGRAIDWTGWRYVELPLNTSSGHWGGAEDGVIHEPLVWDSIFLLDNPTRKQNKGTIYVGAPVVFY